MDALFVKKAGEAPAPPRASAAARQMVGELAAEIVLDEAADPMTPDERKLRNAGRAKGGDKGGGRKPPAPAEMDADSDDDPDAKSLADHFSQIDDGLGNPALRPAPGGAMVDSLFARRVDAPAAPQAGTAAPGPSGQGALADGLFSKRRVEDAPGAKGHTKGPSDGIDGLFARAKPAVAEEDPDDEECDDDDGDCAGTGLPPPDFDDDETAGSKCSRCLSRSRPRCTCQPRAPPMHVVMLVFAAAALATVTAAVAMGCEQDAPLGRYCIADGITQYAVAGAPGAVVLLCALLWLCRSYRSQRHQNASAWRDDAEAQKSAASVLEMLPSTPAQDRHKYTKQVMQILKDFPHKASIQQKGFIALEAICRAKKGNSGRVQSAGAIPVLLLALETHRRVRAVQRTGLSALACLAKVGKSQIFDLGGVEIVLKSMAKFKRDPSVQVSGAMAIGAMCLSSTMNQRSVAKYGGMTLLLEAITRHVDRADVLIASSETLVLLCKGTGGMRKQLQGSLSLIQEAIARYDEAACAGRKKDSADAVLRSLRKLEAVLLGTTASGKKAKQQVADDDSDCSEIGTPRQDQNGEEALHVLQLNASQAFDLQAKLDKWNATKKGKR